MKHSDSMMTVALALVVIICGLRVFVGLAVENMIAGTLVAVVIALAAIQMKLGDS